MSMTSYESEIKTISSNEEVVFAVLSDLSRLESVRDKLPTDKVSGVSISKESVRFTVNGIGEIGFRIIDKEPYKTIKFESEQLPFVVNVWIQLKQVAENDTRMKLTLRAELPTMIKMMLGNKLGEAVNKMADGLSQLPYQQMI